MVFQMVETQGTGELLIEWRIAKAAGDPGIVIFGEPYYYPKFGFVRGKELELTDMEGCLGLY